MGYVDARACEVLLGSGGPTAPVIYVVDGVEHSFGIGELVRERYCTVVNLPVRDWNESLTPWPAPGIYRGNPDFGGKAPHTLAELVHEVIPAIERERGLVVPSRAICGYSLGGLFSLYALTHATFFCACACLSGSVWYEGWVEHLREQPLGGTGRFAYLSIGTKEKRAAPKILHAVQDNMAACADILRARGFEVEYAVGPGNHMAFVNERFDAGLAAVDAYLRERTSAW